MAQSTALKTLLAERRQLLRQRQPLYDALAQVVVRKLPDAELLASTHRLHDQLAVNALQLAAYDPQGALFPDEGPSYA